MVSSGSMSGRAFVHHYNRRGGLFRGLKELAQTVGQRGHLAREVALGLQRVAPEGERTPGGRRVAGLEGRAPLALEPLCVRDARREGRLGGPICWYRSTSRP